jgi:hypothetical protein
LAARARANSIGRRRATGAKGRRPRPIQAATEQETLQHGAGKPRARGWPAPRQLRLRLLQTRLG